MNAEQYQAHLDLLSEVIADSAEDPDVISSTPEVFGVLRELFGHPEINDYCPDHFASSQDYIISAIAGLVPYIENPLDEHGYALIENLSFLVWMLSAQRSPAEVQMMRQPAQELRRIETQG